MVFSLLYIQFATYHMLFICVSQISSNSYFEHLKNLDYSDLVMWMRTCNLDSDQDSDSENTCRKNGNL